MISNLKENSERLFVISYFLSDDTISVHELSRRNAGFKGGEFFAKSKIYFPNQQKFTSERPKAYKSQDLYLGALVNFRNFIFKIISADLFALQFMEAHKDVVSQISHFTYKCSVNFNCLLLKNFCLSSILKVIQLLC